MASFADLLALSRRNHGPDSCRVLLVAPDADRATLRARIADRLPAWEVVEADGLERARFALQLEPCDILMLDAELMREAGALEWFGEVQPLPITLLTDDDADFFCTAVERGATHWLPRDLALRHPALLAAVLRRAGLNGELRRRLHDADLALADCRRQVNRLVNRLWEAVPSERGRNWFTQRHMLDRLQEEVERVKRHGGPLTVVLGELLPAGNDDPHAADELATWAAEQVSRLKRRCDVAGQYGPHGFMLVLPQTAEPGAVGCCRRLRTLLEQPASPLRGPHRACFGLAAVDSDDGTTITRLLSQAEEQLEEEKEKRLTR